MALVPGEARDAGDPAPVFDALDRSECEALLARQNVGRLAFAFHDRVDVEPIHYVYEDGWIYGRTSPGSKINTLRHSQWVAFEVDDIRGPFDWDSVVVHGTFYELMPSGTDIDKRAWQHARDIVQRLVPEAWTDSDPVAFRTIPFRIEAAEMTGRAARER